MYGDTQHELSLQLIIDKFSTPDLFSKAIQQFTCVLLCARDESKTLSNLETCFTALSQINLEKNYQEHVSNDNQVYDSNCSTIIEAFNSLINVLVSLITLNLHKTQTNLCKKNLYNHDRSYDLWSTTCWSSMNVSYLGESGTSLLYFLQSLYPSASQHN